MQANWTRDEIILACYLVYKNGWRELREGDPEVRKLSKLLQRNPQHPPEMRDTRFRSLGSVSRKTADIVTSDDDYTGKKTHGNKLDGEVRKTFLGNPDKMEKIAKEIWAGLERGDFDGLPVDALDTEQEFEAPEGRLLVSRYFKRERNSKLRRDKIASVQRAGRPIACEVCRFDFGEAYGDRGSGYIEVHHATPLHVSGPVKTKLNDLVLLCANCHRMIHRGPKWITVGELRSRLRTAPTGV